MFRNTSSILRTTQKLLKNSKPNLSPNLNQIIRPHLSSSATATKSTRYFSTNKNDVHLFDASRDLFANLDDKEILNPFDDSYVPPPCDITTFYSQYVNAFTSGDMKSVSMKYYKAPIIGNVSNITKGTNQRMVLNTPEEIEAVFNIQMIDLVNRGYQGKSIMDPLEITPLTPTSNLIQSNGVRYVGQGEEVLEHIFASYITEEFEGEGWKITAVFAEIKDPA